VTTDEPEDPVVLEGTARVTRERGEIARFLELAKQKYEAGYTTELLDPDVNATVCVEPRSAFGLAHDDLSGSPTRWRSGGA
jgi:hypothetical protein